MGCPHCGSAATTERSDRTSLGYRKFRCFGIDIETCAVCGGSMKVIAAIEDSVVISV